MNHKHWKKKKLKKQIDKLRKENEILKKELLQKGNVFFQENKWLGINKTTIGVVHDGVNVMLYTYAS